MQNASDLDPVMSKVNLSSISLEDAPFNLAHSRFTNLELILFLCYIIPLIIFTLASNSFVIYAVLTCKSLKNPSNLFLLSLAFTDLLSGIFLMPIAGHYNIAGSWQFGAGICRLWYQLTYYLSNSSIYHLCVIAFDRYLAMAKPLNYVKKRSNKKSFLIICLIWIWSFLLLSPAQLWGITYPKVFQHNTPCTAQQDLNHAIYAAVSSFYLPLLLLVVIYLRVFILNRARLKKKILLSSTRLNTIAIYSKSKEQNSEEVENAQEDSTNEGKRPMKQLAKGSKRRMMVKLTPDLQIKLVKVPASRCHQCQACIPKTNNSNLCQICSSPNDLLLAAEKSRLDILVQRERRSMFVISIIVFTFILCWMPGYTIFLVLHIDPTVVIDPRLISIAWWLTYTNSACNPVIYTVFNRDFRDAISKIFNL